MPRYEKLTNDNELLFFEIEKKGSNLYIKQGSDIRETTEKTIPYGTTYAAKYHYDEHIQSIIEKGYILSSIKSFEFKPINLPRNPELEQMLFENITNEEAWMVYGDWLQTQDDPRGELIMLQALYKNASTGEKGKLTRRIKVLMENKIYWINNQSLVYHFLQDKVEIKNIYKTKTKNMNIAWKNGFIHNAKINYSYDTERPLVNYLVDTEASLFLQSLELNLSYYYYGVREKDNDLDSFLDRNIPNTLSGLRTFTIECSLELKDINLIFTKMPYLENLQLNVGAINFKTIQSNYLKNLYLKSSFNKKNREVLFEKADLPNLETLTVYFYNPKFKEYAFLNPLLQGKIFPNLKHLGLLNGRNARELLIQLENSSLLQQLETLDLTKTDLDHVAITETLLKSPSKFRKLKKITFTGTWVRDNTIEKLRAVFGKEVIVHKWY